MVVMVVKDGGGDDGTSTANTYDVGDSGEDEVLDLVPISFLNKETQTPQ